MTVSQFPEQKRGHREEASHGIRVCIAAICFVVLLVVALGGIRVATLLYLYAHMLRMVTEQTGLDLRWARPVALVAMALVVVVPWWSLVLPWGGQRRIRILLAGVVLAALSAGLGFSTRHVFFDPAGNPVQFYAIIPGGYRLADSPSPGVDRQYGIPFKPITPAAARQILAWEKAGGSVHMQASPCDPAFDLYSGDPVCWYDEDSERHFRFSPVPGTDPELGVLLKPVTPQIITKFQAIARREDQRRRLSQSAEFRSTRVLLSDPPPVPGQSNNAWIDGINQLESGTLILGQIILPKQPPTLPPLDSPDGMVALELQQATGLVPGERLLFRITDNILSGGTIVVPRLSVAEGYVAVWSSPGEQRIVRFGAVFFRIWMHPHSRPVAFNSHLVAEKGFLVSGALNTISLDQCFPAPTSGLRIASSKNSQQ